MSAGAVAGAAAGSLIGQSVFGGFAPFPNSIMIPFMGAQSAVLGYQFGLFYETGKRTIKAMDNDLFNRIVSGSSDKINIIRNGIETTIPINQYIPTLIKSQWKEQITSFRSMLPDAQSLMNDIIQQSVQIEMKKAERTPSAWLEIGQAFAKGASELPLPKEQSKLEDAVKFLSAFTGIPFDKLITMLNLPPLFKVDPPFVPEPEPEEIIPGGRTREPEPDVLPPPEPIPEEEKEPEPVRDLQVIAFNTGNGFGGTIQFEEEHTRSDWMKIINHWYSSFLADTQNSFKRNFYILMGTAFNKQYKAKAWPPPAQSQS